jgi:hypothetical protein
MPDFERLTDRLRVDLATTPEEREWAKGYAAGKTRARIEVAVILAALYFGIALLGRCVTGN